MTRHTISVNNTHTRNRRNRQDPLVIELNNISSEKEPSLFHKITSYLAQWAQVFTLLVVVIGYVYTVIPVFQKEKLSEDIAKLELINSKMTSELEKTKADISSKQEEYRKLNEELLTKILAIESLALKMRETESRFEMANKNLQLKNKAIQEAESQLYLVEKESLIGDGSLPSELIAVMNTLSAPPEFKREQSHNLAKTLERNLHRPLDQAFKNLESLKHRIHNSKTEIQRNTLKKIYSNFETGIEKHKETLACNNPDPSEWQNSFIDAFKLGDRNIEFCVNHNFENLIKENKWIGREVDSLKKSETWATQETRFKSDCRFIINYTIEKSYREHWDYIIKPCTDRFMGISSIILESEKSKDISPLRDVSPPTEQKLQSEITSVVKGRSSE